MNPSWKTSVLSEICHVYQPETLSHKQLVAGDCRVYGANGQIGWHNEFNHEESELILGCRGTCGAVHVTEPRSWINGNAMVVRPINSVVTREFLAYALKGGIKITEAITGTAQPQITRQSLMSLTISFPTEISEQQRIVRLLDEAFEGITIAKTNAEKNLWNASVLFESRLQSLFTQSQTKWKEVVLREVTKKITDGSHNPPPGVPVSKFLMLSSKNVFDDDLDYLNPRYLTAESFDIEHKRTGVIPGDVLLTIVGTIGRCAVVPDGAPHITLQRSVAVIRPDQARLTSRFLMYSLMSRRAELNEQSRGVAQKGIYLESLRNVSVLVPTLEEQVRIVGELDVLQDHTNQLAQIYAQKAKSVDRLGEALLHQAFSGQLAAA
jgi:type I restriction enzyme S subunit